MQVTAQILKDTDFFETADISLLENNPKLKDEKLRVTLMESDGTVIFDNTLAAASMENHINRPEIADAIKNGWGEKIRKSDTIGRVDYYYATILNDGRILRISKEVDSFWFVFMAGLPYCAAIIGIISVIVAFLAILLTKQLMAPILDIAGKLDDDYVESPYRELDPFISQIRKQHEKILDSARRVQDFSANASHELKTPLTAISGYVQLIQTNDLPPEKLTHFSTEIEKNANRLLNLIDDIIELSKLDSGELEQQFEKFDLYRLAQDEVEGLKFNAEKKNITLQLSGDTTFIVGRRDLIRELIANLVENSIRYNTPGGNVTITVNEEYGKKTLTIEDDGIGIPKDDQDKVFERFYRVEKSRSKASGGTGLGLSIVKHIADLHNATITLESDLGQGTRITVEF
jgi:two-component system phosphate regulon sensor histidine kinase PhoR